MGCVTFSRLVIHSAGTTQFFRQNRTNSFADITNTVTFPAGNPAGLNTGVINVVDYDADGKLDIFLNGNYAVYFYRQNTTGKFYNLNNPSSFPSIGALPVLSYCVWQWADLDGDGRLDFALSGYFSGVSAVIARQNSTGIFYPLSNASFPVTPFLAVRFG